MIGGSSAIVIISGLWITELEVYTDIGCGGGVALLSGTSMQIKPSTKHVGVTSFIKNTAQRGAGLYLEEATSLNVVNSSKQKSKCCCGVHIGFMKGDNRQIKSRQSIVPVESKSKPSK